MNKKWLILLALTFILFNISCKKDPISSNPVVVTFKDANFETLIRDAINKPTDDILSTDLLTITKLVGEDSNISDLTGIEHCTNLDTLRLMDNQITDISALSVLTKLLYLDLDNNQITNLSALGSLTNLTKLWLADNQIVDISTLSSLTKLQTLHLEFNKITNINALSGLTNLIHLSLWDNQIIDINALSALINLNYLDLEGNQIADISALSGLTNMTLLWLNDNQIIDIAPLVQNNGIDDGDSIEMKNNPLSDTSINTYIPQLEARGVTVIYGNGKVSSNTNNKSDHKK